MNASSRRLGVVGALLLAGLSPGGAAAQRVISSAAVATVQTSAGVDSISSNTVQTVVVKPEANLAISVVGALTARPGETVKYRITYTNSSQALANLGVFVVDTLPAGLEYVGSLPSATVSGNVLQWTLGDVQANTIKNIELTLRISSQLSDTATALRNRIWSAATNTDPVQASSEAVTITAAPVARILAVTMTAEVLDAGIGETVPFTVIVRNTSTRIVGSVVLRGTVPDGARFSKSGTTGLDSSRVEGREFALFVRGELAPGASVSVHFALTVVSATGKSLVAKVEASADEDQVRATPAEVSVRVGRVGAPQDRALIGKVWVDANNNGVQDAEEQGVAGVDVWTDDGEITTTDNGGRFSYRNLRPGQHGFRVDEQSVPSEFQLAADVSKALVTRISTGWTTSQVSFRLLPRGGRVESVRLPALWSVKTYEQTLVKQQQTVVKQQVTASIARAVLGRTKQAAGRPAQSVIAAQAALAEPVVERLVRYEAVLRNPYAVPLSDVELHFHSALDSAVIFSGDSVLARVVGERITMPAVPPGADLWIIGWSARTSDSVRVDLARAGRLMDATTQFVAEPGPMVGRALLAEFHADSLPEPSRVPVGSEVIARIAAPAIGWRGSASLPLPRGWELVGDSANGSATLGRDRDGSPMLLWQRLGHGGSSDRSTTIEVRLRPAGRAPEPLPTRVSTARTIEERSAEKQREFLDGPGVAIFGIEDGQVLGKDRVFVGVRGVPRAPVTLFDGDAVLGDATLRADGVHDFIAVALKPGPHLLRARMAGTNGTDRWDSAAVHVTGQPARFERDGRQLALVADGHTIDSMRVLVRDAWGVPVANRPEITVAVKGAVAVGADVNGSSLGVQLAPDATGWMSIALRPGQTVGSGTIRLSWSALSQQLAFDVLPATQALLVAGIGQIGIGASPNAFASFTARGRLSQKTSIVASYDSRRLDAGREAFGRNIDPTDQSQYPLLGDGSRQRTMSASRYQLAARVERGYDWLALGDVSTAGFASGLQLSGYRRALPGAAARVTTGAVEWQGFGSSTSQLLRQLQLRGSGSSGPFVLGRAVREGTEHIVIEIRAAENATRVLSRQVLERYVDYQLEYEFGVLLFKQPVPATDTYGNPVFIVALYESDAGGPRSEVWGARASVDAKRLLRAGALDSMRIGGTLVNEGRLAGGHRLLGADLRVMRAGGLELVAEAAHSAVGDSSGTAALVRGALTLFKGAAKLSATWQTAGREFANPANPSVQGGTEEFRLAGDVRQGSHKLVLSQEWQKFGALGLERHHSAASVVQELGKRAQFESAITNDRYRGLTASNAAVGSEFKLAWKASARWSVFTEVRRNLVTGEKNLQPDYVGGGASVTLLKDLALDVRHRQVFLSGDSTSYGITDVGVRTRLGAGTEAYSKYQFAGVDGGRDAALVGARSSWHIGNGGTLTTQFERRRGVGRALTLDPVRALPFLQAEEDYWSAGVGGDLTRTNAPYRVSGRAEYRDGALRRTQLATLVGDLSLHRSLAVLSRQEFTRTEQRLGAVHVAGHRYGTLWGLAYRPVHSQRLNLLGKAEWIDEDRAGYGRAMPGGADRRAIAAAEAIVQPLRGTELAARFAYRHTTTNLTASDGSMLQPRSSANFVGARATAKVLPRVEVRADARLLHQPASGVRTADVAPMLLVVPQRTIEIAGGYRFGELRDADFAVNGGTGWFVTFGARVTEGNMASVADFWRQRLSGR